MNATTMKEAAAGASGESGAASPQELDKLAALARSQAQKVMKKIPLLGPVAWLMMASAGSRHTLLSDLEWRVLPALVLDQAKLFYRDEAPVAYVSWARLSDSAAARFRQAPHQLAPADWRCGSQIWLVDVLVPFGGAQDVLKDLRENLFKGEAVHQLRPVGEVAKVYTWPAC